MLKRCYAGCKPRSHRKSTVTLTIDLLYLSSSLFSVFGCRPIYFHLGLDNYSFRNVRSHGNGQCPFKYQADLATQKMNDECGFVHCRSRPDDFISSIFSNRNKLSFERTVEGRDWNIRRNSSASPNYIYPLRSCHVLRMREQICLHAVSATSWTETVML